VTASLPAVLDGRQLAVVDVEGNGQQPPEIIEIAVLPVDTENSGDRLRSWLVRPKRPINPIVTRKVHGISIENVAGCPSWSVVASEVEPLLADHTLVAHNASVELAILTTHLPGWRPPIVLDTMRLAKHVLPDVDNGYGLDNLVLALELDTSGIGEQRGHRASYHSWCTWKLLLALIEHGELDWYRLVQLAALPGFVPPNEPEGGLW
jgi:DNA polymerase III epsilon subunit-like protein